MLKTMKPKKLFSEILPPPSLDCRDNPTWE